jgi:dipeptidyl aminopeptidase/acylaminoacyl peptidase
MGVMKTGAVIILCVLFFVPAVWAGIPGFTIDQVMSAPFPSSLTADSSGQRIAWVYNHKGVYNIWMAEGLGFNSRQLTDYKKDDGRGLNIWGFIDDIDKGSALVFSKSGRFNPDLDTKWDGKSALFKLNIKDKKIEKLDDNGWAIVSPVTGQLAYSKKGDLYTFSAGEKPQKRFSGRGNLGSLQWSPDGKFLVMQSVRGEFPHRYSFIMIYDLEKDTVRYIDAAVYGDLQPHWSPDGKRIVFIRRLTHGHRGIITSRVFPVPDPWEIRVADLQTGKVKKIWKSPDMDSFSYVRVGWLDNKHVVFLSEADGWRHLYAVPAAGGEARQLTKGKFIVEQFTIVPGLKKVFFNSNSGDIDRRHIWSVGVDGKPKQETSGKTIEWSPVVTGDKKYLAYIGSSAVRPAEVYVKALNGGKARRLTEPSSMKDFPKNLASPHQVIFKSEDGWTIHGQLFRPPKSFKGKRPAVMYFHGGPVRQMLLGFHYSSYYHRGYAMNQYLASQGYVVLSVNFRLGIGYGKAFREVPDGGPRGSSEYRDLLAGAKFLRGLDYVDANRVGLWGGSYGGLMTALGLARNSDLFAAGVDFHGVHDWNQWQAWASDRPNDFNQTVWRSSPLSDIENWRSPVLLIHGDDDRNVPFSETVWLAEKLDKQGVEYELLIFPDDVHGFLLHKNWVNAFKATASFFNRKLTK